MNKELNLLSATKVAQKLNISVPTLNHWYAWYGDPEISLPESTPSLPAYVRSGARGTRYWDASDIAALRKFQKWIPRGRGGVMGAYNSRFWGKRGKVKPVDDSLQSE